MRPNIPADARCNRLIPWYFVAAFMVVIAANAVMIWFASSTHLGVVRDDAYQRGLHYNAVLHQQKAGEALGWNITDAMTKDGLRIHLVDAQNHPIHDAHVTALWVRPLGDASSRTESLNHQGQGMYTMQTDSLKRGQWELHLHVRRRTQEMQRSMRVMVK
jgi:nitrogen fixation protein FixH